jgi:hypothetical protein
MIGESTTQKMMESMPRIPPSPIPGPDKLREMLIAQILDLQSNYRFSGEKHTKNSLKVKSDEYLERLCDMQLYGVASNKVSTRWE